MSSLFPAPGPLPKPLWRQRMMALERAEPAGSVEGLRVLLDHPPAPQSRLRRWFESTFLGTVHREALLVAAIFDGLDRIARFLIEEGVSPYWHDRAAIRQAIRRNDATLALWIIDHTAASASREDLTKALEGAIRRSKIAVAERLIAKGADIAAACRCGQISFLRVHADMLRSLKAAGATLPEDADALLASGEALGDRKVAAPVP